MKNFTLTLVIILCLLTLYKVKWRMGINLLPGEHTPKLVRKYTGIPLDKVTDYQYSKLIKKLLGKC